MSNIKCAVSERNKGCSTKLVNSSYLCTDIQRTCKLRTTIYGNFFTFRWLHSRIYIWTKNVKSKRIVINSSYRHSIIVIHYRLVFKTSMSLRAVESETRHFIDVHSLYVCSNRFWLDITAMKLNNRAVPQIQTVEIEKKTNFDRESKNKFYICRSLDMHKNDNYMTQLQVPAANSIFLQPTYRNCD